MVDSQRHVRCSFEGRDATRNEKESRIAGLEQQRYENSGHYLSSGRVDVPRLIPHLTHRHFP